MPGARTVSFGYSAVQTARLVSALRWVCGRLSEIVEGWATAAAAGDAPTPAAAADAAGVQAGEDPAAADIVAAGVQAGEDPAAAAVEMMVLSRRLASHRGVLDGLQPDSERLSVWRQAAPADASLTEALDEITALEGASERLAVARRVLVPQLVGVYRQIVEHAAPHCDGALASAAGSLGHDLAHAGHHFAAPAGAAADADAERRLSAAGGLVGRSLLRPAAWP